MRVLQRATKIDDHPGSPSCVHVRTLVRRGSNLPAPPTTGNTRAYGFPGRLALPRSHQTSGASGTGRTWLWCSPKNKLNARPPRCVANACWYPVNGSGSRKYRRVVRGRSHCHRAAPMRRTFTGYRGRLLWYSCCLWKT